MAFVSLHSALAATLVLIKGPDRSAMVEVCTNQGVRWVSLEAAASTDEVQKTAPSDSPDGTPHCPLCRFVGDAPVDLHRDDLCFAPPRRFQVPPRAAPVPCATAARVILTSAPRAPPLRHS
ncbi:hypothetical protein AVS7_01824 [Acidovorax sp. MR-S7]|nr:hypothetical protein AVS7_01824 [Acidovorax sp. MR-S7]